MILIPKIVKRIELKGYAEEFGEAYLEVWVNPPVRMLEALRLNALRVGRIAVPAGELSDAEKKALEEEINGIYQEQLALYSALLSEGSEETRLSVEELKRMIEETADTDPMFWAWVKNQLVEMINEHRLASKKG